MSDKVTACRYECHAVISFGERRCGGCGRPTELITRWSQLTSEERASALAHETKRLQRLRAQNKEKKTMKYPVINSTTNT